MAKNRKTVRKGFEYRQCDDFAAYLNHMARQGWHFKQELYGLIFEQGEPEDAVYAVEVFSGATEYDTRPEPKTEEFAEYCEAAGWKMIDAWRKFVVFKRIREDAVPIMTDAERLDSIAKAEKHISLSLWRFPYGIYLIHILNTVFLHPSRLFSTVELILFAIAAVMLLKIPFSSILYYQWKRRYLRQLDAGKKLFFGGQAMIAWHNWLSSMVLITLLIYLALKQGAIYILFLLGIIVIQCMIEFFLAKFRPEAIIHAAIQYAATLLMILCTIALGFYTWQTNTGPEQSKVTPPLTYADMRIDMGEPDIRSFKDTESVFGHKQYANLDYGDDYLFYDIYSTEYGWLLDRLWADETSGKANETRDYCTDAWGAVEAFRNNAGSYLIRYEDALWVISPSLEQPLTQDQIDAVIAALREG